MNISGNDNKRIEYTVRVLLCIAVVLVGRLFFLQIIDKSDLQAKKCKWIENYNLRAVRFMTAMEDHWL